MCCSATDCWAPSGIRQSRRAGQRATSCLSPRLSKVVTAADTHKFRGRGCEAEAGQADFLSRLSTGHQPQSHIKALGGRERERGHGLVHASASRGHHGSTAPCTEGSARHKLLGFSTGASTGATGFSVSGLGGRVSFRLEMKTSPKRLASTQPCFQPACPGSLCPQDQPNPRSATQTQAQKSKRVQQTGEFILPWRAQKCSRKLRASASC